MLERSPEDEVQKAFTLFDDDGYVTLVTLVSLVTLVTLVTLVSLVIT